jgi:hypothetical protein
MDKGKTKDKNDMDNISFQTSPELFYFGYKIINSIGF